MVHLASFLGAVAVASLAATVDLVTAHPGEALHVTSATELAQRKLFHADAHRALKACANAPHARKLQERTVARRAAKVDQLRQQQAANAAHARRRLDATTVLATSHKSNLTSANVDTDPATLFGSTPKCVLEPEVTQGPYYVSGELIRSDVRESQPGVDLYAELQIIDVNTCEPVENLYVDFWHCNTTGVYAGVIASGNGDSSDLTNVDKTFNRGLAPTDADGLVNFITTFPGHYTGRASHIHILGSHDGTVLANGTYSGGKAASVGQLFFDQDLIAQVEATAAYKINTQTITTNAKDSIFVQSAASGFDPVMEYALLGDAVEDGLFAWISVGVDMTIAKSVSAAATLTATGGVMNASNGMGGGGGGGGGNPPSGSGFGGGSRGPPPSGSGVSAPPTDTIIAPSASGSASTGSASTGSASTGSTSTGSASTGADSTTTAPSATTAAPSACVQKLRK